MGVIIRQSVKSTVVSFIGVGIAAFSSLFIYPRYEEVYGLAMFLVGTGTLFYPIASVGIVSALIKFFPRFKTDDDKNRGLLSLSLIGFLVLFVIFAILFISFKESFINWLQSLGLDKQNLLGTYWMVILALTALIILTSLFVNYAACYKRIVIPEILVKISYKIFLPAAILIFAYFKFEEINFAIAIVVFYVLIVISNVVYLSYLGYLKMGKPDWKFLSNKLKKEISTYQLFSSYNHLGSVLAFRVDNVMIPMIIDLSANGIYSIMLFMSQVIEIPTRSIKAIAGPIISQSWESGNIREIETIYKKTSLNLLIPGIAILLFIWFSFDGIASISSEPTKYAIGKYTFLVLGVAKLIDMLTSVNDQIIMYSPKYKYNLIFILILAIINIVLNYWLINKHGILGAAIASAFAYLIYNSIKLIFIYFNYKIHPFDSSVFLVLGIGSCVGLILYFINSMFHPFIQIVISGSVLALIYFPTIYLLNLSPDFNKLCNIVMQRVRNFI